MMRLSDQQARALEPRIRALVARKLDWLPDQLAHRDDLVQHGMVAVVRAAESFDPSRDTQFETWAMAKAHGAILDLLRHIGGRREHSHKRRFRTVSLDAPLGYENGTPLTHGDTLEDEEFELPDPFVRRTLDGALERLTFDQQSVLWLYFEEDYRTREIGELLGVTESRVSQLMTSALERLREDPALDALAY